VFFKKRRRGMSKFISLIIIFLMGINVYAVIPAFPGAEGAGMYATGGRGGEVRIVTNLNDDGIGSLRWAVWSASDRIVVFRVSGTIELDTPISIPSGGPDITIAGQTAPGDGITLNGPLIIRASNVVIRYLRVRLPGTVRGDTDCINIVSGENIILDHCSASWSVDETLSTDMSTGINNVTVQWCIISESLNKSVHSKGPHGKASLLYGSYDSQYSFHHNIYAHHAGRSPRIGPLLNLATDPNGMYFDWRNNVIYNWGGSYAGYTRGDNAMHINYVGNYYKRGSASTGDYAYEETSKHGEGYFDGNWMGGSEPADPWSLVKFVDFNEAEKAVYMRSTEVPMASVTTTDANTAYREVMARAGCAISTRDSVDARIVNEIINGTGSIIDCVDAGDFYYPSGTAVAGTSTTITLADDFENTKYQDDSHNGYDIEILSGTGDGQIRTITNYVASTRVATVSPAWTTPPDATSEYGRIIDCTNNGGGWPALASGTAPTDSDNDGMPNDWETPRGLNPNSNDSAGDRDGDGYTNIEEYLNWLVARGGEPLGDCDNDRDVDEADLDILTTDWLDNDCNNPALGKLNMDCDIDFEDFSILAENWLIDELGL